MLGFELGLRVVVWFDSWHPLPFQGAGIDARLLDLIARFHVQRLALKLGQAFG